jgi:hypothetical protein
MKPENKNNVIKESENNTENCLLIRNEQHKLNETQSSTNSGFSIRRIGELTISEKIKLTSFMIIGLAFLRVFSFDILIMIGELITSVLVYLYSMWNNKCMAILVGINGISGFIYSFIQIFKNLFIAKSEKFGYISTLNFLISIFATIVYFIICYLAYYGFKHFDLLRFGLHKERHDNKKEKDVNETSHYGALNEEKKTELDRSVNIELNGSVIKNDKNIQEKDKEKDKDNVFNKIGEFQDNVKSVGDNFNKIKEGFDQLGNTLNKLK